MATVNSLITHILQNIFVFLNKRAKLIQVWNDMRVSINNIIFIFGWTIPLQKQAVNMKQFVLQKSGNHSVYYHITWMDLQKKIWIKSISQSFEQKNAAAPTRMLFCDEVGWSHQHLSRNRSEFIQWHAKVWEPLVESVKMWIILTK